MKNIWILFKREMASYFYSPIAYIMGICVLLQMGFNFFTYATFLSESPSDYSLMMWFFNGIFTWIMILVIPPVITMRLFADEKKTGTIEALMTTPLRDIEYVLAKFFSAFAFFVALWIPTVNCVFVLRHFAKDTTPLNPGPIIGGYIGLFLVGMLLIAIGCMASASTRNQIIAAIIAFAISCVLFFSGIYFYFHSTDQYREIFEYFSMLVHMQEMSRGAIEWKRVVFYLTGTIFFLFLTHRIVQSRQWKS